MRRGNNGGMSDKMRRRIKGLMLGMSNVDSYGTIRISKWPGMEYTPCLDFFIISSPSFSCSSSSSCCSFLHHFSAQWVRCLTSHKTEVPAPLLAGSRILLLCTNSSLGGECGHFLPVASYHADNEKITKCLGLTSYAVLTHIFQGLFLHSSRA